MKKLRITVDGKVFDVSVELLDQVSSTTAAPAPAPVAAPAPAASAPVAAPAPAATARNLQQFLAPTQITNRYNNIPYESF